MAGEVYVSTQGDTLNDFVLLRQMQLLLGQNPFMRYNCVYDGDTKGTLSDTIRRGQLGDSDVGAVVAEGSSISGNTAVTDDKYDLTPARISIKRTMSDLIAGIGVDSIYDPLALADSCGIRADTIEKLAIL